MEVLNRGSNPGNFFEKYTVKLALKKKKKICIYVVFSQITAKNGSKISQ